MPDSRTMMPPGAAIGADEVRYVAKLAHLEFSSDDIERMQRDLSSMLGYVAKLNELDTASVEPTTHAVDLHGQLRDDVVHDGLAIDEALRNAPLPIGSGFGVPRIIE